MKIIAFDVDLILPSEVLSKMSIKELETIRKNVFNSIKSVTKNIPKITIKEKWKD